MEVRVGRGNAVVLLKLHNLAALDQQAIAASRKWAAQRGAALTDGTHKQPGRGAEAVDPSVSPIGGMNEVAAGGNAAEI
jgi:hypothetical protein